MADPILELLTEFAGKLRAVVEQQTRDDIIRQLTGTASTADYTPVSVNGGRGTPQTKRGRAPRIDVEYEAKRIFGLIEDTGSRQQVQRGFIVKRSGLTESQVTGVLEHLISSGRVKRIGTKRAAHYVTATANHGARARGLDAVSRKLRAVANKSAKANRPKKTKRAKRRA